MNRGVEHIQAHLADPGDLERLAGGACFSPFHFHRLFRAWMGETLQTFVHRLRLERAAQLLVFNRSRSISDIAMECGFSSSSAFARAFKGAFGASASEWRKRKIPKYIFGPGTTVSQKVRDSATLASMIQYTWQQHRNQVVQDYASTTQTAQQYTWPLMRPGDGNTTSFAFPGA